MNYYTIRCQDIENLIKVCAGLVKEGIRFDADTEALVIDCTGGF